MTHEEWLSERKKGIGGSDAAAIVGLSPYKSAFEVYADKLSLVPPKEDNEAMRQGRDLEEYVARRFCEETGKRVRRRNSMIKNPAYPFAFANVDRLIIGENAGLECKTAGSMSVKRYKGGEYPEEYYCQCMHYMAVTGYPVWYLAVLIYSTEFKVFEIKRDEEDIAALMKAEREFWENNVLAKNPPAPSGSDNDNEIINAVYPNANGESVSLIGFDKELARRAELDLLIKKMETEKRQIDQKIKLEMGEAERAECGKYDVVWTGCERRTLDTARLIEDFFSDRDLSDYIKTTRYRTFKIKEIK